MDKQLIYSEFRYNLKARIQSMTRTAQATVRKKVLKDSGMCRSSYYNALTLKHRDKGDIPARMLLAFSKALNVEMEDLFNKKEEEMMG